MLESKFDGQIFDEKNGYGEKTKYNFVLPEELTVTITLSEYRALLRSDTDAKVCELRNENCKLRNEIEDLKNKLEMLQNMFPTRNGVNENA